MRKLTERASSESRISAIPLSKSSSCTDGPSENDMAASPLTKLLPFRERFFELLDQILAQINTGQCGTIFRQDQKEVAADLDGTGAPVHDTRQDMTALCSVVRHEVQMIP